MPSLADVIAGAASGDAGPLGPDQLQAARGLQLQQSAMNNANWADQGWGGALAHAITGFAGPSMTQSAMGDLTQQRIASMPDLAAAYSSPDPFAWAAQNPQADPVARWSVLSQNPSQVAGIKNVMADAALRKAQAAYQMMQVSGLNPPPIVPASGGGATALPGQTPGQTPGQAPVRIGNARYPVTNTTTLPIDVTKIPTGKIQATLATMNDQQRAQAIQQLRAQHSAPAPIQ